MPQAITVSFQLSENELRSIVRNTMYRRVFNSLVNRLIMGWITLTVILGDVALLIGLVTARPIVTTSPVIFVILTLILGIFWFYYFFPRFFIRYIIDKKFFDQQIWQFTDQGIRIELPHASLKYDYSHFERVEEDQEFYYLYPTRHNSSCIPKRVLSDDEQQYFRELVKAKLPNTLE